MASSFPHIALLDLYATGHHFIYIEMLCRQWIATRRQGQLHVWVTAEFIERHPDFQARDGNDGISIHILSFRVERESNVSATRTLLAADSTHGQALEEVATSKPDHILLMYFDHAQLSLARISMPHLKVSGIYFRPTFHYRSSGLREWVRSMRKRIILKRAISNVHILFCIDPYSVETINRVARAKKARAIPDGLSALPSVRDRDELRREMNVNNDAHLALFFGVLSERKGIDNLCSALVHLEGKIRNGLHIAISGSIPAKEKHYVNALLENLPGDMPAHIEIGYLSERRMAELFTASDSVLLPYNKHVGSSNVLIRAAMFGLPVIGSDYGLLGRSIEQHKLGVSMDTRNSESFAQEISNFVAGSTSHFDKKTAIKFGSAHSERAFSDSIFDALN